MADLLETTYEHAFGSKTSKGQLYTGFFLLIAGVGLAVAGIVVFNTSAVDYGWREAAIVLAALSAPSIFLGIFWALPSKVSMRWLAGLGTVLCLVGTLLFSQFYPLQFNAPGNEALGFPDRTAIVIGVYAVGLVLLLAGTFTSLIGYYLSRITLGAGATPTGARGGGLDFEQSASYQYDIPDAVIERDIELAMKRYKYSWGGEGASASDTGIQINVPDEFEAGVKVGGKGIARTVTLETPQVEDATKKLRGMRPSTEKSLEGKWAEDSTKALLDFRKKKQTLEATKASGGPSGSMGARRRKGWWQRFLEFLGFRPKAEPAPEKPK